MTPAGSARTIPTSHGTGGTHAPAAEPVHHALVATPLRSSGRRACRRASSPSRELEAAVPMNRHDEDREKAEEAKKQADGAISELERDRWLAAG